MNLCSGQIYLKEMKIKRHFQILKHVVLSSHSEALARKNAHYPTVILFSSLLFYMGDFKNNASFF